MEVLQIAILIIQILISLVIALGFFIIKSILKRVEVLEEEVKGMKHNYLDRFMRVINNQNETKVELLKEQTKVKDDLQKHNIEVKDELITSLNKINENIALLTGKVNTQTTICQLVQDAKKR